MAQIEITGGDGTTGQTGSEVKVIINSNFTELYAASVFTQDVTFVLSGSKTFGKYSNGDTAAWTGLTAIEALIDAAVEYIDPAFSAFAVTGQSSTVEVGTTLSGSKTFTWTVVANSGVVSTIDIYDVTDVSTLLAATTNDGSQVVTVNTLLLNTSGATQQWKGIANNTSPSGTVDSSTVTVTARFYRFYGAASSSPATSAAVRALASSAFQTSGATFTLNTGSSLTRFVVALPPGVTITSVTDTSALNADITDEYVLTGTVSVTDAGGTSRTYNIYEMTVGVAYSTSHAHSITTT